MGSTSQRAGRGGWSEHRGLLCAAALVGAFALNVLRKTDCITRPQFWAEDGAIHYADAYNRGGFTVLLAQTGGYLDVFARLVAAFSQLFPLAWAPLVFNLSGILVQSLPALFLASSRCSALLPGWRARALLAAVYVGLPNSWEVHAAVIHAKVHLSILAFMVLAAAPDDRLRWRAFDRIVLLLSGLSGPFCIPLLPVAAVLCAVRRDPRTLQSLALVATCAAVQVASLLTSGAREVSPLGATPALFLDILCVQVFLGLLIGQNGLQWLAPRVVPLLNASPFLHGLGTTVFGLCLLLLLVHVARRGPWELRLLFVYAGLLFCAALASPLVVLNEPQWPRMVVPGVGGRYWFTPMIALLCALVWSLGPANPWPGRTLAVIGAGILTIGIVLDWRHPAFSEVDFPQHARRFASAPVGASVSIPLNPPGWSMTLVKHE